MKLPSSIMGKSIIGSPLFHKMALANFITNNPTFTTDLINTLDLNRDIFKTCSLIYFSLSEALRCSRTKSVVVIYHLSLPTASALLPLKP